MKGFLKLYLDSYRGISKPAWLLALIMLINRSGAMVLPFLGVYMTNSLNFSLKEAGNVLACFGIGAISGSWFGGWLTDKVGHYKVQLGSLLLSVPVFCMLPLLQKPLSLGIGIFLLSLITESFRPANSVAITAYANSTQITKAFSLNRMAINLGFSIGPALGGLLAALSYNWLFYGNAFSAGVAGCLVYLFFRKQPSKITFKPVSKETSQIQSGRSPWKDGPFLLFSILCCLYSICFFQLLNTLPLFYRQVHQLSEWDIGLLLGFSGLVVFALEMLLVHIAERHISAGTAIVIGVLFCGISYGMLLIPDSIWVLYIAMTLLCISEILALPFMATVTVKRASEQRGAYMGLNALSFSAAYIISPYAGTRIADNFGFSTLWIITGLITVVTAIGFFIVNKKLKS